VPPDSVRCTRELSAELFTFGKIQRRSVIIHRTVRCTLESVRCPREERLWNSPASGIRSAIIHRTCPVSQRSTDYSAPTVTCYSIKCAPERAEVRHTRSGTPDTLQCMSGVPPDSQAGPQVRAPTVGTQRPGDVAGAPDTVRCAPDCPVCTGLSGAPCDRQPHQTTSLVVGVINTPNHPTFKSSKFSYFNYLQEL
jgi:hypothetical protein